MPLYLFASKWSALFFVFVADHISFILFFSHKAEWSNKSLLFACCKSSQHYTSNFFCIANFCWMLDLSHFLDLQVWGTFIMQKRYKGLDYTWAVLVTIGCSISILYPVSIMMFFQFCVLVIFFKDLTMVVNDICNNQGSIGNNFFGITRIRFYISKSNPLNSS